MKLALLCSGAVVLDRLLNRPERERVLAGFGWLAQRLEHFCYGPVRLAERWRLPLGAVALLALTVPFVLLAWGLAAIPYLGDLFSLALLYLVLTAARLEANVRAVDIALDKADLTEARARAGQLVSRDTATLDAEAISLATIEALLKNYCDAVFGVLFWFSVAGAPAAVGYRLVVVLNARWGYPTLRYRYFGWTTARLERLLNWLPARLTAASYVLVGDRHRGFRCWRTQGLFWRNTNTGVLLAAGAGALRLQLGGAVRYYESLVFRPPLGAGVLPRRPDIARALALAKRALGLWLGTLVLLGLLTLSVLYFGPDWIGANA